MSEPLGRNVIRRVEVALEVDLVPEPAVCPRHVARTLAGLEADEQVAAGAENPGGLGEDARLTRGRCVDDRVPQHHTGELVVGVREVAQRAHGERQVAVVASGHGDHARRQANSLDQTPALGEVPAHPTRAAPRVKDPCAVTGRHRLSEGVDHGEVEGSLGTGVRQTGRVVLRHRVVGVAHRAEVERI